MNRNLLPSPNRDSVQGALPLEPGKGSLNGLVLLQERLSFEGVLNTVLSQQSLVGLIQLQDRSSPVLSLDQTSINKEKDDETEFRDGTSIPSWSILEMRERSPVPIV